MDELVLNNYLMVLKSTVEVYVHGTLESSNKKIRELLKECLNETLSSQAKTYDEMVKYDWYTIEDLDESVITKTKDNVECKK